MILNNAKNCNSCLISKIEGDELEVVETIKLLGTIVSSNEKWKANSQYMISRAYRKLWILGRLMNLGANRNELKLIYQQQVRSVQEFSVSVWAGAVTCELSTEVCISNCARKCIWMVSNAMHTLQIDSLEIRRSHIGLRFAKKASLHERFENWFVLNDNQGIINQNINQWNQEREGYTKAQ